MSSCVMPYMAKQRAVASVHTSRSPFVCGMQMGLPVVPEEQWKRLMSRRGAAVRP